MSIKWNDQSCRWFEAASEYTGFNHLLAEILKKYIPQGESLCDLGCGAGLIDLELGNYCSNITCIDIAPAAIDCVRRGAKRRGIKNLHALYANAFNFQVPHDTVMAFFFGDSQFYENFFHLTQKRLIVAVHRQRKGKFGPDGYQMIKRSDVDSTRAYLDNLGVKYEYEAVSLEYGQPLTDLDDARAFVRAYARPMSDELLEYYLAKKLEKTAVQKWPYYLPNLKEFGLFVIQRSERKGKTLRKICVSEECYQ